MNFFQGGMSSQQSDIQDTPFFNKQNHSIFDQSNAQPQANQAYQLFNTIQQKHKPSILSQLQATSPLKTTQYDHSPQRFIRGGKIESRRPFYETKEKKNMQFSFQEQSVSNEPAPIQKNDQVNRKYSIERWNSNQQHVQYDLPPDRQNIQLCKKEASSKWKSNQMFNHNSQPLNFQTNKASFQPKNQKLFESNFKLKPLNSQIDKIDNKKSKFLCISKDSQVIQNNSQQIQKNPALFKQIIQIQRKPSVDKNSIISMKKQVVSNNQFIPKNWQNIGKQQMNKIIANQKGNKQKQSMNRQQNHRQFILRDSQSSQISKKSDEPKKTEKQINLSYNLNISSQFLNFNNKNEKKMPNFIAKNKLFSRNNQSTFQNNSKQKNQILQQPNSNQSFQIKLQKTNNYSKVAEKVTYHTNKQISQDTQKGNSKEHSFKKLIFRNRIKDQQPDKIVFSIPENISSEVDTGNNRTLAANKNSSQLFPQVSKKVESSPYVPIKEKTIDQNNQNPPSNNRFDKFKKTQTANILVVNDQKQQVTITKPSGQVGLREQLKKFGSRQTQKGDLKKIIQKQISNETHEAREAQINSISSKSSLILKPNTFNNSKAHDLTGKSKDHSFKGNAFNEGMPKANEAIKKSQGSFIRSMMLLLQVGAEAEALRQRVLQKTNSSSQIYLLENESAVRINSLLNRMKINQK